jgi:hypothetical protein
MDRGEISSSVRQVIWLQSKGSNPLYYSWLDSGNHGTTYGTRCSHGSCPQMSKCRAHGTAILAVQDQHNQYLGILFSALQISLTPKASLTWNQIKSTRYSGKSHQLNLLQPGNIKKQTKKSLRQKGLQETNKQTNKQQL